MRAARIDGRPENRMPVVLVDGPDREQMVIWIEEQFNGRRIIELADACLREL